VSCSASGPAADGFYRLLKKTTVMLSEAKHLLYLAENE
jgi:hypothetical protein